MVFESVSKGGDIEKSTMQRDFLDGIRGAKRPFLGDMDSLFYQNLMWSVPRLLLELVVKVGDRPAGFFGQFFDPQRA